MTDPKKKPPVKKGFKGFMARFPNTKLPLTIEHGDQNRFSRKNKPLSLEMALDFIWQEGDDDFGEFTEFVPCFRLPDTKNFHAVVYWKGDMLDYHFFLAIFDQKGEIQEKVQLAGTNVRDGMLDVSVAEIKSSWDIQIHSGTMSVQESDLSKATLSLSGHITVEPSTGKINLN